MKDRCFPLLTDSYKLTHPRLLPPGTTRSYSHFISRNGAKFDTTVFFGLQGFIKKYLQGRVVDKRMLDFSQDFCKKHFGRDLFYRSGWETIINKFDGKLPITIKAVPEGTEIPVNNILMSVEENTDELGGWLTGFLETMLVQLWSPCTVATLSKQVKRICTKYLMDTVGNTDALPFMLHDFGFRGCSSLETAESAGAAHLINFKGTDTVPAILYLMEYYNTDVCAYSVVASEHSIMTSLGPAGEKEVLGNILRENPVGIISIVCDSYDWIRFVNTLVCKEFKQQILDRDGVFVVRPDSGVPETVVLQILNMLEHGFGSTTNGKGFRTLHDKVRVIWGDGLELETIARILENMRVNNWAANNIVFGMGGGLLQKINRDTQRFAFKSSAQKRNGQWYEVFKDPIYGRGTKDTKASRGGKLKLVLNNGIYTTVKENEPGTDVLQTVFQNGELLIDDTYQNIYNRNNF